VYAIAVAVGAPKALDIEPRTKVVVDAEIFKVVLGVAIDVIPVVVVLRSVVPLAAHYDRA
jgi:hypothetical protein